MWQQYVSKFFHYFAQLQILIKTSFFTSNSLLSVHAEVVCMVVSFISIYCKGFAEFIFSVLEKFRSVDGSGFASKNLTFNDASTIKSNPNNSNVLGRGKNCFLGARLCKLAAKILVWCCICVKKMVIQQPPWATYPVTN